MKTLCREREGIHQVLHFTRADRRRAHSPAAAQVGPLVVVEGEPPALVRKRAVVDSRDRGSVVDEPHDRKMIGEE